MSIITRSFLATAGILAFCGLASAYTVSGSVSDEQGKALEGVSVSLLKEGKATTTDNQGKFTLFEDETIGFHAVRNSVGYVKSPFTLMSIWQAVMPSAVPQTLKSISPRWSSSPKISDKIAYFPVFSSVINPMAIPETGFLIFTPQS